MRNQHGWAPLHILANNNQEGETKAQMIRQIVQARAQVDVVGNRGATPLRKAASTAALSQLRMLMELGADTNYTNDHGTTIYDETWHNSRVRDILDQVLAERGAGVSGVGRSLGSTWVKKTIA